MMKKTPAPIDKSAVIRYNFTIIHKTGDTDMKAILTVIGQDKPGIIAEVSAMLAARAINIEDISQTILQGNFTMIMLVDISRCPLPLSELVAQAQALGDAIGVHIYLQHEDIFHAMHTV